MQYRAMTQNITGGVFIFKTGAFNSWIVNVQAKITVLGRHQEASLIPKSQLRENPTRYLANSSEVISCCGQREQLLRRLDILQYIIALSIDQQRMILLNQTPVLDAVGGRLTRNNDMPAMVSGLPGRIRVGAARWQIRVFPVQGGASDSGPVQRGWLLDGVVSQSDCHQLGAIRNTHVQAVRLHVLRAKGFLLQRDDLPVRSDQCVSHLGDRVLAFPARAVPALCQVRHVQRSQVL